MDMTPAIAAARSAVLPADAVQAAFPVPDGIRIVGDLAFAAYGTRQLRLDLYLPRAAGQAPVPCVLVFRGGAWRMGDKETLGYLAGQLAAAGFAAASAEYRPSSEAGYPAALHDAKAAVRWLRTHAAGYGIDAGAIGVIGASSGGYLAAMLATTSHEPAFEGRGGESSASSRVQAVVSMGGVANLALDDAAVAAFLGPAFEQRADLVAAASPVSHVSPQSAPMLLLHSRLDPLVPFEQSLEMEQLYRAAGAPVTLIAIDAPHLHTFWYDPGHCVELLAQAVPFFRTHLTTTA